MLDKMLITYCSPTLSGLKTANMFTHICQGEDINKILDGWNAVLNPKGVSLWIINKRANRVIIYVCRRSKLARDINEEGVREFLKEYGYKEFSAEGCIAQLKKRVEESKDFPHEIGLFLGYPLDDVKGFIENSGKNCKYVGYWKVYSDEVEAIKQFQKYNKCKEIYNKLYKNRVRSVYQLTVAV